MEVTSMLWGVGGGKISFVHADAGDEFGSDSLIHRLRQWPKQRSIINSKAKST